MNKKKAIKLATETVMTIMKPLGAQEGETTAKYHERQFNYAILVIAEVLMKVSK